MNTSLNHFDVGAVTWRDSERRVTGDERRIESTTLPLAVPPLLVQTLVENAVKHGVSRQPGGGLIAIDALVIEEKLSITVTNTGRLTDDDGGGFGLRSVKDRLQLLYGEAASLNLNEVGDAVARPCAFPLGEVDVAADGRDVARNGGDYKSF